MLSSDPATEHRQRTNCKISPVQTGKSFPFAQFLKYDRVVLKFYGYWNDLSEFGDVRRMEIYYYLSDDTIEVKEVLHRNSGREGPAVFLKRGKLIKEWKGLPLPGEKTDKTVLNVLGTGLADGRYVDDCLQTGAKVEVFYTDKDLQIGSHINVYGRDIILVDCDPFTKQYFNRKYGIEEFIPLSYPDKSECNTGTPLHLRKLPPYNGYGTYEDSEGNCLSVEPKPPQIDFKKFVQYDKFILRFGAKMISYIRENCDRKFIISYFLSDDTMQIFEIAERNSGFTGGEFLKRKRMLLPDQEVFISGRPDYYKSQHLFIGSTLKINDHIFHLVSSDEYTLCYMEGHPHEVIYSYFF